MVHSGLKQVYNGYKVRSTYYKAISVVSGGKRNKEIYNKLKDLVYSGNKKEFLKGAQELIDKETSESGIKRKTQHMKYVKNQWKGVEASLEHN